MTFTIQSLFLVFAQYHEVVLVVSTIFLIFFRNVHSETRPVPAGFCFRRIERIFEFSLRRRRRIRPCRCQERAESSHGGDEHLVGREHRLDPRKHKNRERNGQTGFGELVYRFILKIPNSKQLFGTEFIKIGFS